ncbi:MAG: cobyrinate a,c-diamide synthase [Candidatus Eremiobacteraeota bacterium]|nr:cobyrinate a,c-diamide synthase [Candidatus Eremiobacteraeota bacterium]
MNGPARIVVSAAGTGAGKTLVAMALCAVLRDAGLRVRAYKSGPDYIDSRLYSVILGAPAHNLDVWLDGEEGVLRHVAATSGDADVLVIEGMMGLFDGDDAGRTSTATIARLLDAPILTVLDTWTASQSAAAVALGLRAYDTRLRHLGAILNRVGGPSHAAAVSVACARAGVDVLATIPNDDAYAFPERRLGLARHIFEARAAVVERLAAALASQLDLPAILSACSTVTRSGGTDVERTAIRARIAYSEDEAFWFTYPETLEALHRAGAALVAFSPLHDRELPGELDGLWLGGGYPEDYASELSANASMRASIRIAVADGLPTYAECGGLMYLAQSLHTSSGAHEMVGAIEGTTSIAEPRLHLGYREATVATASPLDEAGTPVRAYEFHYATSMLATKSPAYVHSGGSDGAVRGNAVATFLHRHFLPGDPSIARFVAAAAV